MGGGRRQNVFAPSTGVSISAKERKREVTANQPLREVRLPAPLDVVLFNFIDMQAIDLLMGTGGLPATFFFPYKQCIHIYIYISANIYIYISIHIHICYDKIIYICIQYASICLYTDTSYGREIIYKLKPFINIHIYL